METLTYVFLFFAVILLAVQIYIITGLMRLHEIATNIDRIVALVAAMASKMGVTSDDVQKAWGIERGRTPETPKEPKKEEKEPVKEREEKSENQKEKPVKEEEKPEKQEEKPVKEDEDKEGKKKKKNKKKK